MKIAHYLWPEKDAAIEQIDVYKLDSGRSEALLHASKSAEVGQLAAASSALKRKGYEISEETLDEEGRVTIRVNGFKEAEELLSILQKDAHISEPKDMRESGEDVKKTFVEKVRGKAMNLAGIFAVSGHLSLILTGYLLGDKSLKTAGTVFASTNLIYAIKGIGSAGGEIQQEVKNAVKNAQQKGVYIEDTHSVVKQGIYVPDYKTANADDLAKKDGPVEKVWGAVKGPLDYLLNKRPYETGQVASILANAFLAMGDKNADKSLATRVNAISSLTGGVTLSAIPAKSPYLKEEKDDQNAMQKAKSFLQDNVNGIGAFFMTVSNLAIAMAARERFQVFKGVTAAHDKGTAYTFSDAESKGKDTIRVPDASDVTRKKQIFYLNALTAASWFLCGGMTALGSKAQKREYNDQEVQSIVSSMCADVLSTTPADIREAAIDNMAEHLMNTGKLRGTKEELIKAIHEKQELMEKSPWRARVESSQNGAMLAQSGASVGA